MQALDFTPLGAIFDLDDTLLDNNYDAIGQGNHERLRLTAVHEVGHKRQINALIEATAEESVAAFRNAHVHTFSAALWNLFCMLGLRHNPMEIDESDDLLLEITKRKDELYLDALRTEIKEVPGAGAFVDTMFKTTNGNLAIASSAKRRDIDEFLRVQQLQEYFTEDRIISVESITHPKPNPEAFDKAFYTLKLPESSRKQVCAFEDDPRGIMSAKSAGLFTCAITTRYSRKSLENLEVSPDIIVDTYETFEEIFGKAVIE